MTKRYEMIDHTADVMVRCTGNTLEECFENAAYAMFDQIIDAGTIEHSLETTIETTGDDNESRLYAFLSELLFIMDSESVVFNDFRVTFDRDSVKCIAKGEPLSLIKHHAKSEIKAVTYHMLSVDPETPSLTVIFDV